MGIAAETRDQSIARLQTQLVEYADALKFLDGKIAETVAQRAAYAARFDETEAQLNQLLDADE